MATTRQAVEMATERSTGDMPTGAVGNSPGRGERAHGSAEVPARQLDIRDR